MVSLKGRKTANRGLWGRWAPPNLSNTEPFQFYPPVSQRPRHCYLNNSRQNEYGRCFLLSEGLVHVPKCNSPSARSEVTLRVQSCLSLLTGAVPQNHTIECLVLFSSPPASARARVVLNCTAIVIIRFLFPISTADCLRTFRTDLFAQTPNSSEHRGIWASGTAGRPACPLPSPQLPGLPAGHCTEG